MHPCLFHRHQCYSSSGLWILAVKFTERRSYMRCLRLMRFQSKSLVVRPSVSGLNRSDTQGERTLHVMKESHEEAAALKYAVWIDHLSTFNGEELLPKRCNSWLLFGSALHLRQAVAEQHAHRSQSCTDSIWRRRWSADLRFISCRHWNLRLKVCRNMSANANTKHRFSDSKAFKWLDKVSLTRRRTNVVSPTSDSSEIVILISITSQ